MLATILGVDFDPNASYDERKDIWRVSDKIVTHPQRHAIGDRRSRRIVDVGGCRGGVRRLAGKVGN